VPAVDDRPVNLKPMRTSLRRIAAMAHLLRRKVPAGRGQEHLAMIEKAARHLLDLASNVLDLSRLEARRPWS
jgi:signal transduction histidine kinase